jgi:hypothetical protein
MKITNFLIMDDMGNVIEGDPFGNNLAFLCRSCSHPILAIARENQRGSSEDNPAKCRRCGTSHFIDVRIDLEKVYVHRL